MNGHAGRVQSVIRRAIATVTTPQAAREHADGLRKALLRDGVWLVSLAQQLPQADVLDQGLQERLREIGEQVLGLGQDLEAVAQAIAPDTAGPRGE